ncbi:MAG: hypothetical protein Q4F72_10680 [Desulfovibrionaceae bacterium]|nr:hypothetical protein [Desulfovibrionaceae bacterium]
MKNIRTLCLLLLTVLIGGCASGPEAPGFAKVQAPVITPDANSGVVYFVRERAHTGRDFSYYLHEGEAVVGVLQSGSYFMLKAAPGVHTYWAATDVEKDLVDVTLKVEAGKRYFIEGGVHVGFWGEHPELNEVSEETAGQILPDLDYVALTAAGAARAE